MPADMLLFALIAAGLIFWLRSILGTRDGDDLDDKESSMMNSLKKMSESDSNVVSLNVGVGDAYVLPRHVRIDNKTTENMIDDITQDFPNFDLGHFVQGAEGAFRMIIESFADGDLETLENLLAPEVYQAFKSVVNDRKERGETVETQIKDIEKIDIVDACIKGDHLLMTVRFSAREICIVRDKEKNIIAGDLDKTTNMVDVWVFGRELKSEGPEWYLYETRDDEMEDHKTPIPEAGSDKDKNK